MQLYITKPVHHKYGRIKLDKAYKDINELIDECTVWVKKPTFEDPFVCIFENTFCIRGWTSDYGQVGFLKDFPNGTVKDELKRIVLSSIGNDFKESINNKYYKWIGYLNTVIKNVSSIQESNFTLYLTKPCANSIKSRGIDNVNVWLDKPVLETYQSGTLYEYQNFVGLSSISGKYFRKTEHFLLDIFWEKIIDSFDVNRETFLEDITDYNSKPGQSRAEFLIEYYFNIEVDK